MALNRQYLAWVIKDSLYHEIGPLLGPGRERLVLQTACELIDDLAGRELVEPNAYPAELTAAVEAAARGAGIGGGSLGSLLAQLSMKSAAGGAAQTVLNQFADAHAERIRHLPDLRVAMALSASGSLPNQAPYRATVADRLKDYLTKHNPLAAGPSARGFAVESVRRLSAGMSKETYAAHFRHADGAERRLIIRKDGRFRGLMTTVIDEVPLLAFVRPHGLPIPNVLAHEADPAVCGAPFIVVESIAGVADPSRWTDPGTVRLIALQVATHLARLHAIPTEQLTAPPPSWLDPEHLCRSVAGMQSSWRQFGIKPQPLMEAVLEWLATNQPPARAAVLVHGDVGFHNLLIDDGRVTGILDWEMSHLGQAEEDLLCVRPFLGAALSWDDFLAAYRAAGGRYEPAGGEHFYRVFALARIALSLFNIMHAAQSGDESLDTKEVFIGTRFAQSVLLEAFKLTIVH